MVKFPIYLNRPVFCNDLLFYVVVLSLYSDDLFIYESELSIAF